MCAACVVRAVVFVFDVDTVAVVAVVFIVTIIVAVVVVGAELGEIVVVVVVDVVFGVSTAEIVVRLAVVVASNADDVVFAKLAANVGQKAPRSIRNWHTHRRRHWGTAALTCNDQTRRKHNWTGCKHFTKLPS